MSAKAKSFIVEINEAARRCSHADFRSALQMSASRLYNAIENLYLVRTREAMIEAVAAWTRAHKLMTALPPEGDPAPVSGAPEAAKLAA